MTKVEFAQLLTVIKTYYPQEKISADKKTMNAWYMALADMDYVTAQRNAISHVRSDKFPPTVADIRNEKIDKGNKFNNFKQRKYDFNKLEKKLLEAEKAKREEIRLLKAQEIREVE